jgi:hypothetical protein
MKRHNSARVAWWRAVQILGEQHLNLLGSECIEIAVDLAGIEAPIEVAVVHAFKETAPLQAGRFGFDRLLETQWFKARVDRSSGSAKRPV